MKGSEDFARSETIMQIKRMMDFQSKCAELFEKSNPVTITNEEWEKLSELFGINMKDEYKWILSQYGGSCVKEGMMFHSMETTPLASPDGLEPFSFFFGTGGHDSLFRIHDMYAAQLPADFIPIGAVDGGNLLCMKKVDGQIYIWIHDQDARQFYLANENLNDFVMSFQMNHNQLNKNDLGVVGVKCSDRFLKALKGL